MPTKFPCPSCNQKTEITFNLSPIEVTESTGSVSVIDPTKLAGVIKKPDGFKDVLRKVQEKYPQNNINVD